MKDAATNLARSAAPAAALARSGRRKKRFLLASTAALAAVGVAMGVSFLDNSGVASISVSGNTPAGFVWPVSSAGDAPSSSDVTGLRYGTTVGSSKFGTGSSLALPSWAPAAGSPGSVTTAGDLALVDATSLTAQQNMIVNVYVTNLAALGSAYSSWAFPLDIYSCTPSGAGTCSATSSQTAGTSAPWTQVSAAVPFSSGVESFLTSTEGYESFSLPGGAFYDITLDTGGSFYTVSTSTASDLNPSFYFTARASG